MRNGRAWLGMAVIFLCGAVAGVLGSAAFVHHRIRAFHREGPPAVRRLVMHALDWKLDLSSAQKTAIAAILDDVHRDFGLFRDSHQEQIRLIVDRGLQRIEAELTPEQDDAWEDLRGAVEAHLERVRAGGAPDEKR
ncbi:MAG: hypothetical protein HY812_20420 [Planctomycetes bacterium]|nr:hypothetical protein [Planctomycetota bacterium]